jgi:hypothetical protein
MDLLSAYIAEDGGDDPFGAAGQVEVEHDGVHPDHGMPAWLRCQRSWLVVEPLPG